MWGYLRWSLDGAEAMLRLRALWTNGDFEPYSRFHLHRECECNDASRLGQASQSDHMQRPRWAPHLEIIK